ncbi:NUDIX domain-containing protein [Paenibacillus planticolens]|uniref:NUDIX domain-containing protein n=1 Tax=Paenibacillus planticolens TaxID=2654976 RepID=UPI0014918D7D|nr:NUDIX domain-containing protein [Paenibacillus planticolens]
MQSSAQKYAIPVVGALILDRQNRLFLMKSSGKFKDDWIIPGGKIECGETMIEALKREIKEETNLNIENIQFLGVREQINSDKHFIFIEHIATTINSDEVIINSEAVDFGWFTKSQLNSISIATPTKLLIEEHLLPKNMLSV